MRGAVVYLTPDQVVNRALYLAGERSLWDLDEHVRKRDRILAGETECPVIYYRLEGHNGGTDPFAPDCASHWSNPGSTFENVTSDCVGGAAWCSGFDRYQPERQPASIGYGGWFNTDSMLMDARGPRGCFEDLGRPELGTMIVCRSGTRGHVIGHVGIVVGYKLAEWNPDDVACWEAIEVVDVAARSGRANRRTTGRGWYGTDAGFLRQTMAGPVRPLRDLAIVAAAGILLALLLGPGQLS